MESLDGALFTLCESAWVFALIATGQTGLGGWGTEYLDPMVVGLVFAAIRIRQHRRAPAPVQHARSALLVHAA